MLNGKLQKLKEEFEAILEQDRINAENDNYENESGNLFDCIVYCGNIEQAIDYLETCEEEQEKQLLELARELLNFMDENNITFINA